MTHLTMLEGAFRLPAGHTLQCYAGSEPIVRKYWSYEELQGEVSTGFHENATRLRMLLIESTQRRLPDDGKIAVELSGGLDLTAVAGSRINMPRPPLLLFCCVSWIPGSRRLGAHRGGSAPSPDTE